jgi:RNA polymerase sigma-70 factor, ECF subfamily
VTGTRNGWDMDPGLVVRAQQGDEAAFAAITRAVDDRFLQVAYRVLRDRNSAQDAVQQALLTIWGTLPQLRDPARFEAWSYRVLMNVCLTETRRRTRWRTVTLTLDVPARPDDIGAVGDRDQLERAFERLSPEQRAVVVLHHYLGMSTVEVAETLDIPLGTANSRLGRAMTTLRQALAADRPAARLSDGGSGR